MFCHESNWGFSLLLVLETKETCSVSGTNRREIQRYSSYEQGSGGGSGATLTFFDDLTAELKLQQRAMGGITVDGLVVFREKPLHEMHGLLRVDSIQLMQEARQVAGFQLAAQLWQIPEGDYATEEDFLSELNWDREHLFFAGAAYEYLKMPASIPRVPYDVGLLDMQPYTYWNKTFDLILIARFAPNEVSDSACRDLLEC
jgi:hypothetical protein